MEQVVENKMGYAPVKTLLLSMALPVVLSTAVQSLYNIVDGIFVAQLGEDAMAAITFANPLVNVLIAIGSGIAVGMNTMLSHGLGAKKQKEVNDAASAAIWMTVVLGIIMIGFSFLAIQPYMAWQTDNALIAGLGVQYMRVYFMFGIATMGQLVFERMLISTGRTSYSMISQAAGGILNIILDPILIFGYFGLPAMGITGAAVATVFSQCVATVIALTLNVKKNDDVQLSFQLIPNMYAVGRIIKLGLPTTVIQALSSIMMISYNSILNKFSTTAVATFGVCCRVTGFFYAILNALCSATIPLIAFNHGAGNKKRIDETIKYGFIYSIIMMSVGTVLCVGFPKVFLNLFNATEEQIAIGVIGMRALCGFYILCAVRNMSNCIIQALGHSVTSMMVDLSRNYLVLIPAAYLLSLTNRLELVWLSVPVADLVSAIVGVVILVHYYKKDISNMSKEPEIASELVSQQLA